MNLTRMMRDTSLSNLEWLNDPKTYEPQDKDTDQKDDLAIEWGRGDASVIDRPATTIKSEMKLINSDKDVETLVDYVQVLMHQGFPKEEVMRQAKTHFPQETIDAAAKHLAVVFKAEGIVGCVAIDLRYTKKPGDIVRAAMKSPFKRHIAYVIMDTESAANSSFVKHRKIANGTTDGGGIDGFFSGSERVASSEMVYEPLNLPVIAGRADLDPEYYDATLVDLVNVAGITEGEVKKLYSAEGSAWKKLSVAFRAAMRRRFAKKAGSETARDRSSDYKMEASILEADVPTLKVKANLNIMMDTAEPELDVINDSGMGDLEFTESNMSEFGLSGMVPSDLEIEPETVMDDEFVGGDEFELDPISSPIDALKVDRYGEFEV
jgi:hypothetical protein